ncbi:undecaprenyl-diphosphate phosphatase [Paenibacillus flagellatus]|uniref:Undecaprenyl-diphosphatase n=1 Tax=Paenibacillus flagellatus TaxID=2211139 RepID=A0A2V5KC57_9BACL|nr:undecaprenyl-diphosphate phosphatase [Paenibacillus flagellatus]PYI57171.1 undecaprenyl-diphosphatase [Paenibacillus flagellatus]
MFSLWVAFVIGIVEGLTEFLPVSSTGHMILAGNMLGFTGDKAETFEVVIQLGAILAVAVIYWRRVLRLFGMRDEAARAKPRRINLLHIALAIVPALGLAFVFRDWIKMLFMPETVVIGLVAGGIFMIVGEKQQPKITATDMDELTYRQSLFIGIAQCLSLWPGFSRSGATIAGGMLAGASRAAAADFTFLIAIPVMCAATGYELLKSYGTMTPDDIGFLAVGFVVSFVVALLAVVTFIKLVGKLKLTYFSYYRFALAAVVLLYMYTVGFPG